MEEPHERLRRVREARGYRSSSAAARAMRIDDSGYRHHENGTRGMPTEKAKLYARFYKIPLEWLLDGPRSGISDPLDQDGSASRGIRVIPDPEAPDPINPDAGPHLGSETGIQGIPQDGIAQLDASGGMGGGGLTIVNEGVPGRSGMTFAAEAISDYWRLPSNVLAPMGLRTKDAIMLKVKGDSNAPILLEGDYVMVDTRHRWPSPDGFYAFLDDFGEIIVKRLRATDESDDEERWVEIISANPAYPARKRPVSDLRIIGRVTSRFSAVF
jgi:hypothetical protein